MKSEQLLQQMCGPVHTMISEKQTAELCHMLDSPERNIKRVEAKLQKYAKKGGWLYSLLAKANTKLCPPWLLTEKLLTQSHGDKGNTTLHMLANSGRLNELPARFLTEKLMLVKNSNGENVLFAAVNSNKLAAFPNELKTTKVITAPTRPPIVCLAAAKGTIHQLGPAVTNNMLTRHYISMFNRNIERTHATETTAGLLHVYASPLTIACAEGKTRTLPPEVLSEANLIKRHWAFDYAPIHWIAELGNLNKIPNLTKKVLSHTTSNDESVLAITARKHLCNMPKDWLDEEILSATHTVNLGKPFQSVSFLRRLMCSAGEKPNKYKYIANGDYRLGTIYEPACEMHALHHIPSKFLTPKVLLRKTEGVPLVHKMISSGYFDIPYAQDMPFSAITTEVLLAKNTNNDATTAEMLVARKAATSVFLRIDLPKELEHIIPADILQQLKDAKAARATLEPVSQSTTEIDMF